jgi:23S rRNA pseudouridine2604 synthase
MTFRHRLQYLLVKKLQISNKEAFSLISDGKIRVNGLVCVENDVINEVDEVKYFENVLQIPKKYLYIAYYKPRGIETTMNVAIKDNLKEILPFDYEVFPVGRLDKASEGLLLLTNNGKIFDKTLKKEFAVEKEYIVTVGKVIQDEFLTKMASGVEIMTKTTLPCLIEKIGDFQFSIILKQGLNRQIRRMCYKLDYEVTNLVRIKIGNISLNDLQPNEYRFVKWDI